MKYALFLIIMGFGLAAQAALIHIEITIDAEGPLFWLDKHNDPDAYDNLEAAKIEEFFLEATQKAQLYCRQALGSDVEIRKNKDWTSIHASTTRTFAIKHHSSIQCIRELDLNSQDPTIGKYLEHAHFVLANFSDKGSSQDNHQLVANTFKILKQIGAPAVPLLWGLYVKLGDLENTHDRFIHALKDIIKTNELSVLNELISAIFVFDAFPISSASDYVHLMRQKANLLRIGRWHFNKFLQKTSDALDAAINNYIADDHIYCFEWTGNISVIIALLYGVENWLNDRLSDGSINNSNDRYIRDFIYNKLVNLRSRAPNICLIKEFLIIARQFKLPSVTAIQVF